MIPYASVNSVYEICENLLNKDGRGMFTPEDFNTFARKAQLDVFQQLLEAYQRYKANRLRYLNYGRENWNDIQAVRDHLRTLQKNNIALTQINANTFEYPTDYAYYLDLKTSDIECDIYENSEAGFVTRSFVGQPSASFPVGILEGTLIKLLPTTITTATLSYYKVPQGSTTDGTPSTESPTWGYTTVDDEPVYDASTSINFELPQVVEERLVNVILSYGGLNLRDAEVIQVSEAYKAEARNQVS